MRYWISLSFVLLSFFTVANETTKKEKNQNDATKVTTKIGLSYIDELSISGSLALDEVRKINTRHSLNLFGFISDDNYGRINKLGMTYTYEFK
jgi:hypothetical protein